MSCPICTVTAKIRSMSFIVTSGRWKMRIELSLASPSTVSNTGLFVPPPDRRNASVIQNWHSEKSAAFVDEAPVNRWKTIHLPSWHSQFETSPALVPGCETSSTLFSSSSARLLCHTRCCCIHHIHCLGPTILTISALQSFLLLIMTQAGQLLHITGTFIITVKAHVHLQNWMKDVIQRLEHFCLWVHRWCMWKCVRDRQRKKERQRLLLKLK